MPHFDEAAYTDKRCYNSTEADLGANTSSTQAKHLAVVSAATQRDIQATEEAPAVQSLAGGDSGRDTAVETALQHISAQAQTTEVTVEVALPDASVSANVANLQNRNSRSVTTLYSD